MGQPARGMWTRDPPRAQPITEEGTVRQPELLDAPDDPDDDDDPDDVADDEPEPALDDEPADPDPADPDPADPDPEPDESDEPDEPDDPADPDDPALAGTVEDFDEEDRESVR